jgi:hypothetical protein
MREAKSRKAMNLVLEKRAHCTFRDRSSREALDHNGGRGMACNYFK